MHEQSSAPICQEVLAGASDVRRLEEVPLLGIRWVCAPCQSEVSRGMHEVPLYAIIHGAAYMVLAADSTIAVNDGHMERYYALFPCLVA